MILVLNNSVVDDIDVLVLKVLRVYAVCGVKSLMSSIISSTAFFAALAAAIFAARCLLNDRLVLRITNVPLTNSFDWQNLTFKVNRQLHNEQPQQLS